MEHELFDRLFKELLRLSDTAVINFINGLFDEDHPLSSTVERSNTELGNDQDGQQRRNGIHKTVAGYGVPGV